jgi:hypothetical protein
MIIATVIAVALGMTPINENAPEQTVVGQFDSLVGSYTQSSDARGVIRVHGTHPRTGVPYTLTIDRTGLVHADIGEREVEFRAREIG